MDAPVFVCVFLYIYFILLCIFSIDLSAAVLHATHAESEIKSTQSSGFAWSACLMHSIIMSVSQNAVYCLWCCVTFNSHPAVLGIQRSVFKSASNTVGRI